MGLLDLFRRKPQLTIHDEFHRYAQDIAALNKQRDGLYQKITLAVR